MSKEIQALKQRLAKLEERVSGENEEIVAVGKMRANAFIDHLTEHDDVLEVLVPQLKLAIERIEMLEGKVSPRLAKDLTKLGRFIGTEHPKGQSHLDRLTPGKRWKKRK